MRTYKTLPHTLALLALSVLAGCSSDDTEATDALADDSRLIRFTMAGTDGATTRSASAYTGETFHVMADHTTDNPATNESSWTAYMPNQTATKISSEWKTSTSYYLPNSGTLRFYAYNGLTPNSRSAGSAPTFNVTAQETNQTDLLTYTTDVAYNASGAVPVQFSHAMAAVWFSIKSGSKPGTVGNITIPGVSNSGTYTIGAGWSSLGSSTTYMVDYSGHSTASNSLFLIPQSLTGKTVTIQFTPTGGSLTNLTATLPTLNLQPGYRYQLQLEIRTEVKITNTIQPWDSDTPIAPAVPVKMPPKGGLPGLFTINAAGDKVFFSQGNLQYQASTGIWRFAENQWDYVGDESKGTVYVDEVKSNNASISSTYTGWIDLFGWGTSGYEFDSGYGTAYQPWSISMEETDYGPIDGTSSLTDTYVLGDWGSNAISNGGNTANSGWRTLTGGPGGEWEYLFNTRSASTVNGTVNARYVKAKVCDVLGLIIFPDSYTHPDGVTLPNYINSMPTTNANNYNTSDWSKMESAGCVFLPAAGMRGRYEYVYYAGSTIYYWSSSAHTSSSNWAYSLSNFSSNLSFSGSSRDNGNSVRLVLDVE